MLYVKPRNRFLFWPTDGRLTFKTVMEFSCRGWDNAARGNQMSRRNQAKTSFGTAIARCTGTGKSKPEVTMNWDQVKGNWKQVKGKVKQQWGKLTDDELDEIEGKRDQLLGKIQKQYGLSKEEAERQVNDWERQL